MNTRIEHEMNSEAELQTAILALQPRERIHLLTALLEQLTPAEQVQVIMRLAPGAAGAIKAGKRNQAARTTKRSPTIDSWRPDPVLDEAESSWQNIMESLEAYRSRVLA
jgi:hypothetical protein